MSYAELVPDTEDSFSNDHKNDESDKTAEAKDRETVFLKRVMFVVINTSHYSVVCDKETEVAELSMDFGYKGHFLFLRPIFIAIVKAHDWGGKGACDRDKDSKE